MAFPLVVVSPVDSSATQSECDIYTPVYQNQLAPDKVKNISPAGDPSETETTTEEEK